jgi:Protein of unknown function (DUF4058)
MKSPFPGMDPYIEANGLWEDFHDDLIGELKRALAGVLPERYYVQTGERSYIVLAGVDNKEDHLLKPDVGVLAPPGRETKRRAASGTAVAEQTTADEVTARAFIDERYRENFIEIYEEDGGQLRLVTCLEILSPSNKRSNTKGRKLYLRKRNALLLGSAHFVEIDLLRGGARMPMLDPLPESPYYVLLCRQERAPYCRVRKAYFDRALPDLTIPLGDNDPDVVLPLQPLVDAVYERSRYARRLDYNKPLTPPLIAEQIAWLQGRLRGATETTQQTASAKRPRRRK